MPVVMITGASAGAGRASARRFAAPGVRIGLGISDRMMARDAYEAQMDDEPAGDRPDYLYETVPGDYAARGRFGRRAISRSPAIRASENRDLLLSVGALAALGFAAAILSPGARSRRT